MRLQKLVIAGFKSFADKTIFEFPKNFTAVVGPNGSGKSNIADAIRWVLGEQSTKTLRTKQSQDVIFVGSDKLNKLGMASVELYLDNSDQTIPLEYNEIVLSRKIFRSGESEYRINNAKVRLQDIIMMLAKAKFGQKSYAVIGQGMIGHFLNATPQERKLFFDEATGVKEYQIKRDQAINKMIRSEENLLQAQTLLAEIEPHLKSLTRQVQRLQKREKVEEELRDVQLQYFGSTWNELVIEHNEYKHQIGNHAHEIEKLEKDYAAQQDASDLLAKEASRGERYQELQSRYHEILEQKGALLKEQAILKGKLELEHQKQGELSLVWMHRKEDELLRSAQELSGQLRLLKEQLQREENERERKEKNLNSLHDELRDVEYQIVELKKRIEKEGHAMSVPEIQEELHSIFAEQESFLEQLLQTRTLDEFKTVQLEAKRVMLGFAEFMDRLNHDEKEVMESLRVEMRQMEMTLERLVQERETAQKEMNTLHVSINSAQTRSEFVHQQLTRVQEEIGTVEAEIHEATAEKDENMQKSEAAAVATQVTQFDERIEKIDIQLESVRKEMDAFNTEEEKKKTQLLDIQNQLRALQRKLTQARQQLSAGEVQLARIETRQEDIVNEIKREVEEGLHQRIFDFSPSDLTPGATENRAVLQKRMIVLKKQLDAIGSVDDETVKEYTSTQERYTFLEQQTSDLAKSIESLEEVIDELDKTIHSQFQKNFKIINEGFQHYFKVLFNGGQAKLTLITQAEESPESVAPAEGDAPRAEVVEEKKEFVAQRKKKQKLISGIDVMASPPGKKITHVTALSGGEKSMVAIALLCSIIAHNPSPFVFLDEVEAALDEENSEKLSAILKDLSTKTQLIVITHNRVTMRAADILFGVTMGSEGKSHILSVELKEAEQLAEEE